MSVQRDPGSRLHAALLRRLRALNRPARPEPTGTRARLRRVEGIRAVLFDVYGTLLTCPLGEPASTGAPFVAHAAREALAAAGFEILTPAAPTRLAAMLPEAIACSHKRRLREGIAHPEIEIRDIWRGVLRALRAGGQIAGRLSPGAIHAVAVEFEGRVNPAWPMPEVRETLERMAGAGLRLGIVSNAQFYTPLLLEALPGSGWREGRFDPALCTFSYRFGEAKPSRRLVSEALTLLRERDGIGPAETLCVGNDPVKDVAPARDAGCRTALFAGDRLSLRPWPRGHGAGSGADLIVIRMGQLADCLL